MQSPNRLRDVRAERRMSQRELAIRASVSPATVTMVERWNYRPTERIRVQIAAALNVGVDHVWPPDAVAVA